MDDLSGVGPALGHRGCIDDAPASPARPSSVDGTSAGLGGIGLVIAASSVEVRGFSITNFDEDGMFVQSGSGSTIAGNYIGLLPDGSTAAGNGQDGIEVDAAATANTIGGPNPADRNVISANGQEGLLVLSAGNTIENNYLGTDVTGLLDRGNADEGLDLNGAFNAIVTDNVISGNDGEGVQVLTSPGATFLANLIGVGSDGTTALGNTGDGVTLNFGDSLQVVFGGTGPGEGNTIAHNGDEGVSIHGNSNNITSLGNSIHSNTALGWDLNGDGHTPNDADDLDAGPNEQLNHPEITSATESGGTVTVDFDLDVPAGTYRVEAFTNPSGADPSTYGEGEVFESGTSIVHTGSGAESFQIIYTGSAGDIVSLAATEELAGPSYDSTSEFSAVATVTAAAVDSDGDGLWDHEEDANTDLDNDPSTNPAPDTDGDTTPNYLDADDDGDDTPTSAENADPNTDGDPRDALDTDHDGQPDYLDTEAGPSVTPITAEQKISSATGGLVGPIDDNDSMGENVASLGDLDGNGVVDIAVAAPLDDDGGTDRGAVYVLFLNADGTVASEQKISDTQGGLSGALANSDQFGYSV
ncbi:MAG: right-handed parallel beta-helix repeat-containing protein, partial [Acidimicrobiales bacterium]